MVSYNCNLFPFRIPEQANKTTIEVKTLIISPISLDYNLKSISLSSNFLVVYDCDLEMLNADSSSTLIKDIFIALGASLTFALGNTGLDVR